MLHEAIARYHEILGSGSCAEDSQARLDSTPATSILRPLGYEWRSHSLKCEERTSIFSAIIAFVHYVYLIRSVNQPHKSCVGYTENLRLRMTAHNNGSSTHTSQYRPWILITYLGFSDKYRVYHFERYLKSSSGKAFARKRLWSA